MHQQDAKLNNLFINHLSTDPFFFFAVVLTVVISIVLHELAHGWAAIRCGDDTPIHLNRMTGNPLVHMGPFSIMALLIAGIAWGQMPVDRTRLRGRYAEAFVAAAGPATNLLLAGVALTALAIWLRFGTIDGSDQIQVNAGKFFFLFGATNVMLCLFNLFPVPPLDGSSILANFNRSYANLIRDPSKQPMFFIAFVVVFAVAGPLFAKVHFWAFRYVLMLSDNIEGLLTLFS